VILAYDEFSFEFELDGFFSLLRGAGGIVDVGIG